MATAVVTFECPLCHRRTGSPIATAVAGCTNHLGRNAVVMTPTTTKK